MPARSSGLGLRHNSDDDLGHIDNQHGDQNETAGIIGPVIFGAIIVVVTLAGLYLLFYLSLKKEKDEKQEHQVRNPDLEGVRLLRTTTDATDWLLDLECGINPDAGARIGTANEFETAPWFVSILTTAILAQDGGTLLKETRYLCRGTIISKKWILTATHCLSSLPQPKFCIKNCIVIAGSHRGEDGQYFFGSQHRIVQEIPFDSDYDYEHSNDIALLEVTPSFTFRKHSTPTKGSISRICLPEANENTEFTSKIFEVSLDEHSAKINSMFNDSFYLKLNLTTETALIVDNEDCANLTDKELIKKLSEDKDWKDVIDSEATICTTFVDPKVDYCKYSNVSGSLLVKQQNRFTQIGVTSMSLTDNCVNEPLWYTVHTKVSYFREWIRNITLV